MAVAQALNGLRQRVEAARQSRQRLARRLRRLDALGQPTENGKAEPDLELADLLRDRARGDAELFGRLMKLPQRVAASKARRALSEGSRGRGGLTGIDGVQSEAEFFSASRRR